MRILILNRVEPPAPGATGRLVAELATHLRAGSHDVQTITTGKLPAKTLPYLLSLLSIGWRACFARTADCVVVMSDPPMLQCWIPFLKLRHRKVIFWCQDLYPDAFPVVGLRLPDVIQRMLENLNRWALQRADQVITLGECMAVRLKKYVCDVTIIANWSERDIMPSEISASEPMTILYAGNIGLVHPVDEIVTAIQSCADLPVRLILMTGGKGADALHAALSTQGNVAFLPPQSWERAQQIQSQSHVHLIALKDEALGMAMPVKTYAAIQNQRPYIFLGPDACEAARLIRQYQCGDIIANQNAADLGRIIQNYIQARGLPGSVWEQKLHHIRAISLPDSLSLVAAAILSR